MSLPAEAPRPPGALPGLRERDYVQGVITVIGTLVLILVAIWLTFTVLGIAFCGCTTASPVP